MQSGVANLAPFLYDSLLNGTNTGRAIRDGGDVLEGINQDLNETKENIQKNAETFEEDWRNNALMKPFIELGEQSNKFWTWYWGQQQKADEYNLGDHVSADEAMEFVKNGGEITIQPEKTIIEPDDNWVFPEDASIDEIMEWMNSRNGGNLTPGGLDSGVNAGVYAGVNGAGTGEQLTSQDIAEFNKVPEAMTTAVAKAVGGIKVQMDRVTVGYMVAPIVSTLIASEIG